MKKLLKVSTLLAIGAVGILILSGCTKSTLFSVTGALNNTSKENYYMRVGERATPQPSDIVAPGQSNLISISFKGDEGDGTKRMNDHIRVHVSKDGTTQFKEDRPAVNYDYVDGKVMYVKWDGNTFNISY